MKKVLNLIVLPSIVFVFCLFSFAACATPVEIESKGHFYMTSFGGGLENLPYERWEMNDGLYYDSDKILISSKEELDELFSETYSQSWSEEEEKWVRDDRFMNLMNKYDEEFFENNQIVSFFVTASGGNYKFELSEIIYDSEVLTVKVIQKDEDEDGYWALVPWFALIEIEKVPVDTEIRVVTLGRGW